MNDQPKQNKPVKYRLRDSPFFYWLDGETVMFQQSDDPPTVSWLSKESFIWVRDHLCDVVEDKVENR